MFLIYISCGWVAGIILGSKFNVPLALIFTGLFPLLSVIVNRRYVKPAILTGLCLVAFFGGACYYRASLPTEDDSHLRYYNDRGTTEIRGLVDRDPEQRDRNARLHLAVSEIKLDEEWHKVSGTALVFVPRYPGYSYGDMLLVKGKLETPSQLDDFDYENYLAVKGIYSTIYYPGVDILETGKGFKPLEWIYTLRHNLSDIIAEVLPEPQASLTRGIVLGMRSDIPSQTRDDFSRTGTAHLLAISGLHLSIVAGILVTLGTRLFGRKGYIYVWLALAAIWVYAVLTGMNPPVLRAAIMVSVFLAAELLGRQRSAVTTLVFAAAVMIGITPTVLWDASFQMSFTAMAGLIFIFPIIQSLCRKLIHSKLGEGGAVASTTAMVTDSFSVSLGAVIAVWPLIAYYFGAVSPAAPLATFFALPALPGVIVTGALGGVLGLVFLPGAQVIAWLGWLFTSYILLVVKAFTIIPSFESKSIGVLPVLLYYLILVAIIWLVHKRKKAFEYLAPADGFISRLPGKWVIPPLLAVAVLVCVTASTLPDSRLHTSFLDVGQGDAILIQKDNRQILVDGGPSRQAISLSLGKEMPFWDRTIDLVVLTHPDADHITGLIEVLKKYRVKHVLYPAVESESALYHEFLGLIKEKNVEITPAEAGQRIRFDSGISLDVLNPLTPIQGSDIDNNGVVLRLKMEEVSFLLTGDIMQKAEYGLIVRRAGLESTVLKVAHHGSSTSTTSEFLEVVCPRIAVISVGEDNRFGHPTEEVMDRLEEKVGSGNIYRTDLDGTIEFITDGLRLWVAVDR